MPATARTFATRGTWSWCVTRGSSQSLGLHHGIQDCFKLRNKTNSEVHGILDRLSFVWYSMYADQLTWWFQHFRPSQFLIWSSKDFHNVRKVLLSHTSVATTTHRTLRHTCRSWWSGWACRCRT